MADWVLPIFRRAIEIKEGLRLNEEYWEFSRCHKELLALLQKPVPEPLRSDILGDQRNFDASFTSTRTGGFFGARYALACWLDEIFITDSPWRTQWNENKMETSLYEITLRAQKFWDQAQRALSRPGRDAIEIYYLCVMLGFRGDMAEKPRELEAWRRHIEEQILQTEDRAYTPPPALKINPDVRLLKGERVMQKWFMVVVGIALLFIPVLVVLAANLMR